MLTSKAKKSPPNWPGFEGKVFGMDKNPRRSGTSVFCFFLSVTQEICTLFFNIDWWTISNECFESPFMLTVIAFRDFCCFESVRWSVILISYVCVWPTSLESGIVFESTVLLIFLAWLGNTWKLQCDRQRWYSVCDYGLLANKCYSILASICSKLKYAQIWDIWNIVQPSVGGIQSLVESRDYQWTPHTWAHLPLVLHFFIFEGFFSEVSVGYCLVFSRGLRHFLGFILKSSPVIHFHQHLCLVRDLVMVRLWRWGWVAAWLSSLGFLVNFEVFLWQCFYSLFLLLYVHPQFS